MQCETPPNDLLRGYGCVNKYKRNIKNKKPLIVVDGLDLHLNKYAHTKLGIEDTR